MARLIRLFVPVVIAVMLGPLIAGLAVCILALATNIFEYTGSLPVADLFKMFGIYIIFAYLAGGVIALLAGIFVSIWMIWRPPSAIVVVAAAVIATSGYVAAGALGCLGLAERTNACSNFLFTLVLAVLAAAGCWLLARRFLRTE
jgi:hypothetical protein